MLSKAYDFVLSAVSAAYRTRRMDAALQSRLAALQPSVWEGLVAGPDDRRVDSYLRADLTTAAIQSLNPSWVEHHRVTRVCLHKDFGKASKHEYIVLTTLFPGDPQPFYIALERTREAEISSVPSEDGSTPRQLPSQPIKPSKKNSLTSLVESSFAIKTGGYGALDRLRFIYEEDANKNLLLEFKPRHALSIFDVAVLACVLHATSPQHQLLKRQCFWHSFMVYEVLLKIYGAAGDRGEIMLQEDKKEKKERKAALKRGTWIVNINNRQDLLDGVQEISAKFEAQLAIEREDLQKKIMGPIKAQQELARKEQEAGRKEEEIARLRGELEAMKMQAHI